MPKFFCNKLGRDKRFADDKAKGIHATHKYLQGQELHSALKNKLIEEATEVHSATDKIEIIAELADVLEVIDGICNAYNITSTELLAQKEKYYQERGGFKNGYFVEYFELTESHPSTKYFRANADRYKEE